VLGWNTDKRYLAELAAAGVPVVPTTYVTGTFAPPPGEYVVKPTVSAAGLDTTRYGPGQEAAARSHVARLRAAGRGVIVQPYVHAIEEQHETSLLYLGGDFSHGARKGPLLAGTTVGATDSTDRAGAQAMAAGPRAPSPEERDLAEAVLAAVAVAVPSPLLYARVDLVPGPDGPQLLEVELTEPFLFLGTSEGAADRLATAIADWPS
jgi:glutathione synthase/RimK-type ligase-like ATP-grasp enzyme